MAVAAAARRRRLPRRAAQQAQRQCTSGVLSRCGASAEQPCATASSAAQQDGKRGALWQAGCFVLLEKHGPRDHSLVGLCCRAPRLSADWSPAPFHAACLTMRLTWTCRIAFLFCLALGPWLTCLAPWAPDHPPSHIAFILCSVNGLSGILEIPSYLV